MGEVFSPEVATYVQQNKIATDDILTFEGTNIPKFFSTLLIKTESQSPFYIYVPPYQQLIDGTVTKDGGLYGYDGEKMPRNLIFFASGRPNEQFKAMIRDTLAHTTGSRT